MTESNETIVVGGGCFWCVQAAFKDFPGVVSSASGYAGGTTDKPSYEQVCTGNTGHAEVVSITFDPTKVSLGKILQRFFKIHDPTQVDRQGEDVGTQYRSIIMYTAEHQGPLIHEAIQEAEETTKGPLATKVEKLDTFFRAEEYHQNYYEHNASSNPYCTRVIKPKLEHLQELESKGAA